MGRAKAIGEGEGEGKKEKKAPQQISQLERRFAQILKGEVVHLARFVEHVDHESGPLSRPLPGGCQPCYGLSACCTYIGC